MEYILKSMKTAKATISGNTDGRTVGVKQKKGKWIVDDEFIDCSVCRREKWSRIPYENLVRRFRYCPKCGARMEKDDE